MSPCILDTYGQHAQDCTYLFAHQKRGKGALNSPSSLLGDFQGWAVHDAWASYFSYSQVKHVLCNAHILRELNALIEKGSRLQDLLLEAYQRHKEGKSADESLQARYEV